MRPKTQFKRPSTKYMLSLWLLVATLSAMSQLGLAQDGTSETSQPALKQATGDSGIRTIILEAGGDVPEPPVFFTANAVAQAKVDIHHVDQEIALTIKVLQGKAQTLSCGLEGEGEVMKVTGENLGAWSIRQQGTERFLDLRLDESRDVLAVQIRIRTQIVQLPAVIDLAHLSAGNSVGFASVATIDYVPGVSGTVSAAEGFTPLKSADGASRYQTSTGGRLELSLNYDGAALAAVELMDMSLAGELHSTGNSVQFRLQGTARVTEPNSEITILSGAAAIAKMPEDANYRVRLVVGSDGPFYKLVFSETGSFPIAIDFVAPLSRLSDGSRSIDFTVAASAVVPLKLDGLDSELEFDRDQASVVPLRKDGSWLGFLPATGRAKLQWKVDRPTGDGKLFFTTTSQLEATVDAGLLRQEHQLTFQVLQGELKSFSILLQGPGEVLDVQGNNIVRWEVSGEGEERKLEITLSQLLTGESQIRVRSQTTLGVFPVRVDGLRLHPIDAVRHSGYVRLSNLGSVRIEPIDLHGLTQLAPDQFPGDAIQARQVFVYRFPTAEYAFTVTADRIQSEVNVSELTLYEVTESDRAIRSDVELDIREAPIREWNLSIPADYSVVAVTGANVADTVVASEAEAGLRNLKVIFNQDVDGRQLIGLHLEKSEVAEEVDWVLPRLAFPGAKSVRGDIGIIGAPGFRIAVVEVALLVEKPLAYFPKPSPDLQQAFRIREPEWSATMHIERLARSIQADLFQLYSLSEETVYGSALFNYFVTGSPVTEWRIAVPQHLVNVAVDGQDVRTWRREGETLIVGLHQPVMGAYTLLVTFEEKPDKGSNSFRPGQIEPIGTQSERGIIQVVSPTQVEISTLSISPDLLKLDPLELPAEFRLLRTAPALGTWQYTARPFDLNLQIGWFQPGTMVTQVVEFAEANSRLSLDGEVVTDILYFVKSRGQPSFKLTLPPEPARLWSVSVNDRPVTARQADGVTLIPLPGGLDPNIPIEVGLRLGKPTVDEFNPKLSLPIVYAPVLKTQWQVSGNEEYAVVPNGGTVSPSQPVVRPTGYVWIANHGMLSLLLIGLLTSIGTWGIRRQQWFGAIGLLSLAIAVGASLFTAAQALSQMVPPAPLQLSLPILSAGEAVELQVNNVPMWRANLSWNGLIVFVCGFVFTAGSFAIKRVRIRVLLRCAGVLLLAVGSLLQGDGATLFFVLVAFGIAGLLFTPKAFGWMQDFQQASHNQLDKPGGNCDLENVANTGGVGPATTALIMFALLLASAATSHAQTSTGLEAADSITQQWQVSHQHLSLIANGVVRVSGYPGDRFLLLRAPAVLTGFEGKGLRLTKQDIPGEGLAYVISIPASNDGGEENGDAAAQASAATYEATFEYQLEALRPTEGMAVLTGNAVVQQINFNYDEDGWDVVSPTAVRVEIVEAADTTQANILLGPGRSHLILKPQARDITTEETQFFVEAANLYILGPGIVDGRHRLHLRTSRGQVKELTVQVPPGLAVSAVNGPIDSWQFDAESGRLKLEVGSADTPTFDVLIETQRGLEPLPSEVALLPLKVMEANGEIGLVAIAFGPEAQPEKAESAQMSVVSLGDFDESLLANSQALLHRVYRYGADGGELAVRIAAVESEVRVVSQQVLSLGDERLVLSVQFAAEISRAGLFQLSFPLPEGLEVESLTGATLHHWAELADGESRKIILHLNGKTIGTQNFSLTLTGPTPTNVGEWEIPHFELNEATRQVGELVAKPTTGIRLSTVSRQNVSESDPRELGAGSQGVLAFRLLQRDWKLVLGIEQLDPWVTGQVLHEVTYREGQTRTALMASLNVQNASIRTMQVVLPIAAEDELKTVRAIGDGVSDFVRTAPDSNIWEVRFKRRVVGKIDFRIEYERRGESVNDSETVRPVEFPLARQLAYFLGVRASGRLELEIDSSSSGWQRVDWGSIPSNLRQLENRAAPAIALRAVGPPMTLVIGTKRHSLADALRLRVAQGVLTTVLSPTGSQLTAVDATIEVIQLGRLSITLPKEGQLFSIFVNGESVNSIRLKGTANTWQFNILPGIDDHSAQVRFVYSVEGKSLDNLKLFSPELNVPLENILWNVIAPLGFELVDNDGNLELVRKTNHETYDRDTYLAKAQGKRQVQAQQATLLLEQANQLLQAGEQTKARWALNSVANQYALDAASNEDARVQLENLQTQQAIVGLNTRRQRLFLDNSREDTNSAINPQLKEAAAENPILQQDQMNFRPQQLSQLLRGNTTEENANLGQIAARLVQQQRSTEPAPQAIVISLPEEGTMYTFSRSVQVVESQPMELDLDFKSLFSLRWWQMATVVALVVILAACMSSTTNPVALPKRVDSPEHANT